MSKKENPSFTVDGKQYEIKYTRALHLAFEQMQEDKRNDDNYQRETAEYARLKTEVEALQNRYFKARDAWFDNPTDKDLKAAYDALNAAYKAIYDEFVDYTVKHKNVGETDKYALDCIERLVIIALQQQYGMTEEKATETWEKYVDENGQDEAVKFIVCMGKVFFVSEDDDSVNPFVAKTLKAETERKKGLAKIGK